MEVVNSQKETGESTGLRLVPEQKDPQKFPAIEKQFVNFMFFRVNPDWAEAQRGDQAHFQK
jgi:hypothetical protein